MLYLIIVILFTFFLFWVKDDSDVRFLLAEGMVIVERELGYNEVMLACSAPILRNIFSYEISTPEINLSEGAPNPEIDPKWLLERTIEVDIIKLFIIRNEQCSFLY